MPTYLVRWEIDIEAATPQEAAERALATQRDPDSIAPVFEVWGCAGSARMGMPGKMIDLTPEEDV